MLRASVLGAVAIRSGGGRSLHVMNLVFVGTKYAYGSVNFFKWGIQQFESTLDNCLLYAEPCRHQLVLEIALADPWCACVGLSCAATKNYNLQMPAAIMTLHRLEFSGVYLNPNIYIYKKKIRPDQTEQRQAVQDITVQDSTWEFSGGYMYLNTNNNKKKIIKIIIRSNTILISLS